MLKFVKNKDNNVFIINFAFTLYVLTLACSLRGGMMMSRIIFPLISSERKPCIEMTRFKPSDDTVKNTKN